MKPWKESIVKFRWWPDSGTWQVVNKEAAWCELVPLDDRAFKVRGELPTVWQKTRDLERI